MNRSPSLVSLIPIIENALEIYSNLAAHSLATHSESSRGRLSKPWSKMDQRFSLLLLLLLLLLFRTLPYRAYPTTLN